MKYFWKKLFFSINPDLCEILGNGGKITQLLPPPCLKHVRIMLEPWNLVPKCTNISSFRKYEFVLRFSYFWSKFYVKVTSSSGVLTIFFYKGLTRNPEITSKPVWDLFKVFNLEQVRTTKCDTYVSNQCYWKLENARVTVSTVSVILKKNYKGIKLPPSHPD